MVDESSDDDRQSDGWGKMVDRRDGWSDRQITGLAGWVTDRHVNDELMGWRTDWSYDGQTGITDRLAVSWNRWMCPYDGLTVQWLGGSTDGLMGS